MNLIDYDQVTRDIQEQNDRETLPSWVADILWGDRTAPKTDIVGKFWFGPFCHRWTPEKCARFFPEFTHWRFTRQPLALDTSPFPDQEQEAEGMRVAAAIVDSLLAVIPGV